MKWIDHKLPAALEKILERLLAARTFEHIVLFDSDHRQPAPFGVDAVVLLGELFLVRQKFFRSLSHWSRETIGGWGIALLVISSSLPQLSNEIFSTVDDVGRVAEIADGCDLVGTPLQQHEIFRR